MSRRAPAVTATVALTGALAVALAVAGAAAGAAGGAGAGTIGAATEIANGQAPDPVTVNGVMLQSATGSTHSYAVPAGGAVITAFTHRAGPSAGSVTFKVYRPTATAGSYTVIGSVTQPVTAGQLATFAERIPVHPGDLLGLSSTTGLALAYDGAAADQVLTGPGTDPAVGTTATFGSVQHGYLLDLTATVEPDADGDGYGDLTQDLCPSDPSTQAACVDTTLTKKPRSTVYTTSHKAKVKLKFTASVAGATFQCSVDGAAVEACSSPYKAKFKLGKHSFEVRAVKASGAVDPEPASVVFKVKQQG
jgi:hypothetical protein